MNIERKRFEERNGGRGLTGHITLDKLAIPETVRVTILEREIIPESFDCFGHPNFTREQTMLFRFMQEELIRQNQGEYTQLRAQIVYKERKFNVPRESFDTVEGIKKSLQSLSAFNEMLNNRKIFFKIHKKECLNEFVVFGCYRIDRFCEIPSISIAQKEKLILNGDVEEYRTFVARNKTEIEFESIIYAVPTPDAVCPCCGKKLTIKDVKNNPCIYAEGKFYHEKCWHSYRKYVEIDKFTTRLMDGLYKRKDYEFELLPNGDCNNDSCSSIPWFLFHTIDGDIIMGYKKKTILIEWQSNYKPFDLKKLFKSEPTYRWEKDEKRGIYALGLDKAFEYLRRVIQTVNPGYSPEL